MKAILGFSYLMIVCLITNTIIRVSSTPSPYSFPEAIPSEGKSGMKNMEVPVTSESLQNFRNPFYEKENSSKTLFERKLLLDESVRDEYAVNFFSLDKSTQKEICKELPKKYADNQKDQNKTSSDLELVKYQLSLCEKTQAGLEAEFNFFPCHCPHISTHHFILYDQIQRDGINIPIRSTFDGSSPFLFNQEKNHENICGMGFDITSFYYKTNWQEIKNSLNNELRINDLPDLPPNKSYEFRTFGALDAGQFTACFGILGLWINLFKSEKVKTLTVPLQNNEDINVPYFVKENIPVCIKSYLKSDELVYKPQITVTVHLFNFSKESLWMLNHPNLGNNSLLQIALSAFIDETKDINFLDQTLNVEGVQKEQKEIFEYQASGIKYLKNLNIKPSIKTFYDLSSPRLVNQLNLLWIIAVQWFKDDNLKNGKDLCNAKASNSYLKAYSAFLFRKSEIVNIEKKVFEEVLYRTTPFFDIYLPYEVCFIMSQANNNSFIDRMMSLKKVFSFWAAQKDVNEMKMDNFEVYFSKLINEFEEHSTLKKQKFCFKYSFSFYLVDACHMPDDSKKLILNHFYEETILPMTTVEDRDSEWVTFELRSIPVKEFHETQFFSEFAQKFFLA